MQLSKDSVPFFIDRWLGGTQGMTHDEKGAYLDLLILQCKKGSFTLEQAEKTLGTAAFPKLWGTLGEKFVVNGEGRYFNAPLLGIIVGEAEKSEQQAVRARKKSPRLPGETPGVVPGLSPAPVWQSGVYSISNVLCIITYLNTVLCTKYSEKNKKTQSAIKARIGEGYDLEDFKKVIDSRNALWKDDAKMNQYLRPETLFGGKFEGYLNYAIKNPPNQAAVSTADDVTNNILNKLHNGNNPSNGPGLLT